MAQQKQSMIGRKRLILALTNNVTIGKSIISLCPDSLNVIGKWYLFQSQNS